MTNNICNILLLLLFFDNCLIFFNSCSDCTYFNPIAELAIPTEILTNEAKEETERRSVTTEIKRK